jgi:two-component system NarL family response regulator
MSMTPGKWEVTKVLLAEDHAMVADFMIQVLNKEDDLRVVAHARDGRQAVELYTRYRPDVVVMDLGMPGMDGIEAIAAIKQFDPACKILVLTALGGVELARRGLRAGAKGYLLKGDNSQELLKGIRAIRDDGHYISSPVAVELAASQQDELTERELDVLKLLVNHSTLQTAQMLGITEHGVRWHIQKILYKLGVENRVQAIEKARNLGLLAIQ